jgi:hypothetical protein
MTAHTVKGEYTFACDACHASVTPRLQASLHAAWAQAQSDGWRSVRREWGKFRHYCPDCSYQGAAA